MLREGIVAIVAHDAGGAEILSSLIKNYKIPFKTSLKGPAIKIFQKKLGQLKGESLNQVIKECEWVLTGTGWSTSFEYEAIKIAKEQNKYVVSFIDHWVNYRERFNWHGPEILPDEIWVGDEDALKLASKELPEVKARLFTNPFWQDCIELVHSIPEKTERKKKKVLFVSSNIDGIKATQSDINFSDKDVFNRFISQIDKQDYLQEVYEITMKPHPSEEPDKYFDFNGLLNSKNLIINNDTDNLALIIKHDLVVGYESMMLVLANLMGKTTVNIGMGLKRMKVIPDKFVDHVL